MSVIWLNRTTQNLMRMNYADYLTQRSHWAAQQLDMALQDVSPDSCQLMDEIYNDVMAAEVSDTGVEGRRIRSAFRELVS